MGETLEDGRDARLGSKYLETVKQNDNPKRKGPAIAILTEESFCDLLYDSLPPDERPSKAPPPPAPAPPASTAVASGAGGASASLAVVPSTAAAATSLSRLWVDRHAPASFEQFLGNAKELQALDGWLRAWESTQAAARATAAEGGAKVKKSSLPPRAALLSGA